MPAFSLPSLHLWAVAVGLQIYVCGGSTFAFLPSSNRVTNAEPRFCCATSLNRNFNPVSIEVLQTRRTSACGHFTLAQLSQRTRERTLCMQDASWSPFNFATPNESWSALHVAAWFGNDDSARSLLDEGHTIDPRTNSGHTPLHITAETGNVKVAELLLSNGGDINARTARQHTPLHLAIEHKQLEMIDMLIRRGAALDAKDTIGRQPIHLAAHHAALSELPDMLYSLLKHDCPVNGACALGLTPLDVAIYKQAPAACIEALLKKGAKLGVHLWNKQTSIHSASFLGREATVDLLLSAGAIADAKLYLQAADGLAERAGTYFGQEGVFTMQARAAAYQKALDALEGEEGETEWHGGASETRLALLLRLGAVQMRLHSNTTRPRDSVAEATFGKAWLLQSPESNNDRDKEEYVRDQMSLALAGRVEEKEMHTASQVEDLCVRLDEAGALQRAVTLWREQGVVVFPKLLHAADMEILRAHAFEVCVGSDEGAVDRTANIRKPGNRMLRAAGVRARPEVLEAIAKKLTPFLNAALQDTQHLVLEHSVYRIQPWAAAQEWHRDDGLVDSRLVSLQVSLVDTAAEQGAFQVYPGTHRCSTRESARADTGAPPPLTIAVPAGSVLCYSPNVMHRGNANTHTKDRLVFALSLMASHALIPQGVPFAIHEDDEGQWWLRGGELHACSTEDAAC